MKYEDETEVDIERAGTVINRLVWTVAVAMMVFSLGTVTELLTDHGVSRYIAWIMAPAVDVGLCVALVGDQVLHRFGVTVGWGTVLRWLTGLITWTLNTAHSWLQFDQGGRWDPDTVGICIHSVPPLLLVVLMEAAQAYRIGIAKAKREARERAEKAAAEQRAERAARAASARAGTSGTDSGGTGTKSGTGSRAPAGTGTGANAGTGATPGTGGSVPVGNGTPAGTGSGDRSGDGHGDGKAVGQATRAMLAYWIDEVRAGRTPTGADLDRAAGTNPDNGLGRRRVKAWKDRPLAELQAELAGAE